MGSQTIKNGKGFLKWHKKKERLHKGYNFARPVVIFKKFNKEVFWSIPMTRKRKSGKFYVPVDLGDGEERSAIISQLRLVDAKRLLDKFTVLKTEDYAKIQKAVINLCQS